MEGNELSLQEQNRHLNTGPVAQPLKTEAHVCSQGARPPCSLNTGLNSQSADSSPCRTPSLHREQTMTHTVGEAAFHSSPHVSPGDQQGWRAVHRRQSGIRNSYQNSLFVSNCWELTAAPTGKKHRPCSTSSGPRTCGQHFLTSSKRAGLKVDPTFSPLPWAVTQDTSCR